CAAAVAASTSAQAARSEEREATWPTASAALVADDHLRLDQAVVTGSSTNVMLRQVTLRDVKPRRMPHHAKTRQAIHIASRQHFVTSSHVTSNHPSSYQATSRQATIMFVVTMC
ncbi:Protein of unknown function, partial [Gryllus bimaculatus]